MTLMPFVIIGSSNGHFAVFPILWIPTRLLPVYDPNDPAAAWSIGDDDVVKIEVAVTEIHGAAVGEEESVRVGWSLGKRQPWKRS